MATTQPVGAGSCGPLGVGPGEDWKAVAGSLDSIEKVSQAVSSHLQDGAV